MVQTLPQSSIVAMFTPAAGLIWPATPLLSFNRISIITNIKWFDMLQRDILNLSPLSPPRK